MLGADFEMESRAIVEHAPKARQTLFFSATFPDAVRGLSRHLQKKPKEIAAAAAGTAQVTQTFFEVEPDRRVAAPAHLLSQHRPDSAQVFCFTRNDAKDVEAQIPSRAFPVLGLPGANEHPDHAEGRVSYATETAVGSE